MHVKKVEGARPGWPSVQLIDSMGEPVVSANEYQGCAKFVTTPEYAPRLRERLWTEDQLAVDARERGWLREVERHHRIGDRLRHLLDELGEPHTDPAG